MVSKTFKRELAVGVLVFWGLVATNFFFFMDEISLIEALTEPFSAVTWAVFSYVAAAFGMEWVSKQTKWGNKNDTDASVPPPDVE